MRIAALAFGLVLALAGAARADEAILVLDASGSMWGQIEGKTKVEIARSVMGGLIDKLPAERHLGLVAYGHRREADCTDIEEVVPVGTDRAAIRKSVDTMNFKGKTPLGAAVRLAADKLKYKSTKATVILVSDGAENCGVDPCALGRELEAQGVDFTAHVIGFGLASQTESAGLKCLAEATGGKYFAAKNAGELTAALTQTVAAPPEKPVVTKTTHVTLRATELDGGPEITKGLAWTIKPASGAAVFEKSDAGTIEADIPPGAYEVNVVRAADGLKGSAKLEALASNERTVTIPLEFSLKAALTVTPAAAAPTNSKVSVAWEGPNRKGDYVTIVKTGAAVTDYLDYKETSRGNPLDITIPVEPGQYEMRYVLGAPQRVLASVPIKAEAVTASLTVPPTAGTGSTIEVTWTGPGNAGDWITVVKPDAPATSYNDYFDAKPPEKHALKLPTEAGDYEVRYVQGGQKVIARAPIKAMAASATVTVPATAAAGSQIDIAWTGPNNSGDWITVVKPDAAATAYNDYFDTKSNDRSVVLPTEGGDYEARYVQNGQKVIARAPIKVTPAVASITAPASVAAGSQFEISWTGPNYQSDWLTIVKPDRAPSEYASYVDAPNGGPGKLTAPATPGTYELRYSLRGKTIIARKPIEVMAP